ncbi:MAG: group II intron reverse transcriptase/maturase, partial [Hyphomicrobiaceae bacterium]|nr:group II intron reverse transcriptase/maturase [Hyphomicrobiaceae bacterium]
PKKDGGVRYLGVPTVADRVAQTVVKMVLEPQLEAHFDPDSYGYRPGKSAKDAVAATRTRCWKYDWVVEFDIKGAFDNLDHDLMMKALRKHTNCRWILLYVERWLQAPVVMANGEMRTRERGTPQGGVISPLLANIYMNRFLKHWRLSKCSETFHAHVVAYADDFVILSRSRANEALAWTKAVMTRLGLTLNEEKTSLKNARQERFDFLGYAFGPHHLGANGKWYLGASPSKKSVQRFKTKVRKLLVPGNHDPWPEVGDRLNRSLRGWSGYFSYGTYRRVHRGVDRYVYERVRDFLVRRHKVAGRGSRRFSTDIVYEELALLRPERLP